jgi:hypothetical protein
VVLSSFHAYQGYVPDFQKAHSGAVGVSDMSLHDAVQNAASPSLVGTLVCIITITVLLCCCMSKGILPASKIKVLFRLLLELTLLAIVSFSAAVIVLSIFHTRFQQHTQAFSDLGLVIGGHLTGPLDFASKRGR